MIYYIAGYLSYKLFYFLKSLSFLMDKISRTLEFYAFFTFFLKKKEELKEKKDVGFSRKDQEVQKGIELSFRKEKNRDLFDYNEAGFFVTDEPQVLFTSFDVFSKNYLK